MRVIKVKMPITAIRIPRVASGFSRKNSASRSKPRKAALVARMLPDHFPADLTGFLWRECLRRREGVAIEGVIDATKKRRHSVIMAILGREGDKVRRGRSNFQKNHPTRIMADMINITISKMTHKGVGGSSGPIVMKKSIENNSKLSKAPIMVGSSMIAKRRRIGICRKNEK